MARPFLKWAGGKAKLASAILEAAPVRIDTYIEPFLGGGAVFFAMEEAGKFRHATLADSNSELIATYRQLQSDPQCVISALELVAAAYLPASQPVREAIYYAVRTVEPESPAGQAARVIFLNKTGYNGLHRVNRKGEFNVPHGDYVRPPILDRDLLVSAANALGGVTLLNEDFESVCARARPGDFVYLDPPYYPLSRTSSFTSYAGVFGRSEHLRLRDVFRDLTDRGVAALLSNSDHPHVRNLYDDRRFHIQVVSMSRAINSVGSGRRPIHELLISNGCNHGHSIEVEPEVKPEPDFQVV